MPTLSVIMIVRDEAHCLADCLASAADIADEFVVCDTGSTDGTPAVAEAFGARVLHIGWRDDFAWARNQSIESATGDWLLHLDADELLDADAAQQIRAIVDGDGDGADAIELVMANYCDTPRAWRWVPVPPEDEYARGHAGYVRVELLRLFRNGRGFQYREAVHENITQSVLEADGVVGSSDILIHHYGYDPESDRSRAKQRRYLDIARKKAADHPDDAKCLHDLAEQAFACGHADEAERACRAALALDSGSRNVIMTLANLLLNRGALNEARDLLDGLVGAGQAPPQALVALGAIAYHQGRLEDATDHLDAALALDGRAPMARLYRARVLDRQGRSALAFAELAMVRDGAPRIREFRDRLRAHALRTEGEEHFRRGDTEQALACFLEGIKLDGEDPLLHNDLGVVLHALDRRDQALDCFRRALKIAPGMREAEDNLETI